MVAWSRCGARRARVAFFIEAAAPRCIDCIESPPVWEAHLLVSLSNDPKADRVGEPAPLGEAEPSQSCDLP